MSRTSALVVRKCHAFRYCEPFAGGGSKVGAFWANTGGPHTTTTLIQFSRARGGPMTKARKARIDSATQAVKVMASAVKSLEPPAHAPLDDDALPFWDDIIAARAKSEWTAHDLAFAADLANAMAMLFRERAELRKEGSTAMSLKGSPMANPRVAIIHGLHAQIKSARQSLSIHGRAAGEARDVGKRRAHAKAVEGDNPLEADDDLLARPALN